MRTLFPTLLFGVALLVGPPAHATITTTFNAGQLVVTSVDEVQITLACATGTVTVNGAVPPDAGVVPCATVTGIVANGNALDNQISLAAMTAVDFPALTATELNGGDGADSIVGSFQADTINGNGGNDTLDGHDNPLATTDQVFGGDGDDVMTWNPGKDDDVNVGGAGNDTSVIVGGGVGEVFAITAVGGTVHFERTLANGAPAAFFVDITETELLRVNANGGNDVLTAATLAAGLIALELNGGDGDDTLTGSDGADLIRGDLGNDILDGDDNPLATTDQVFGGDGDDVMTWNPGKDDDVNVGGAGNDTSVIVGGGVGEVFLIAANGGATRLQRTTANGAPAAFFVDITETERLRVSANGGDDTIDASALGAGAIALELNGGDGNDSLKGGPDADLMRGGPGNDTLQPGENPLAAPDQSFGDEGDDIFLWNAGDDSDVNDGGDGHDSLIVNAAGADETFVIERIGDRTHLVRTLPSNFEIDNGTIESLQLNAGAGDDIVNTSLLPGVAQVLDGGASATAAGDRLTVAGYAGDASVSPILKPGFGAIEHSGFERAQAGREGGSFSAALEGAQEVPPVATPATGRGTVTLNASETEITVQLSFEALGSNSTMAHIHGPAAPGFNAPPIFTLTGLGGTSGVLGPFVFAVTPQQVQELKSGLWYFNVHSVDAPGGEIRGQILADMVLEAIVEQRQVVPRSNSSARGFATVTLAGTSDQVVVTLVYYGLVGESAPGVSTAVRIHGPSARGSNGGVIDAILLPVSGLASDAFVSSPFAITAAQAEELRSGLWYIEVASQEFPAGEIRGQFSGSIFFDNFE